MKAAKFRTLVTLALLGAYAAPALAAPAVSNLVCRKVKDLKIPGVIAPAPDLTNSFSYFGTSNCDLGKMTQICTPSSLDGSPYPEPFVGQCCFKAKCPDEFSLAITVVDAGTGAPAFGPNQVMTNEKISLVCIACSYP